MEMEELLQAILIFLIIYCLVRFIVDNYKLIRAQNFLKDPENGKLLLAMSKYVNYIAELGDRKSRVPEISSIDEFRELGTLDRDLVVYTVGVLLENKQAYINFFKERGDI